MPRTPQDITDAELAVLSQLWDSGPATIRQLTDALYPAGGFAHYTTVQKLLERLQAKGCVQRLDGGRAHRYRAVVGRDELIGRSLRQVAEKLCGGSLTPLLTNLVRLQRLTVREREELRALIGELASRPKTERR